jgi:hypothetical protein
MRSKLRESGLGPLIVVGWLFANSACGFPKPAPIVDDAGNVDDAGPVIDGGDVDATPASGCTGDEQCSGTTPFCVDRSCSLCRSSSNCSASRPVCDMASHDCRSCVKDSECDSGACDLAAGTCVDQSAIRYASPSGTPADPCARLLPCSLDKAATSVDAGHPYIVLLPGVHVVGAGFGAQNATICGNDATINANSAVFVVSNGSSVTMRDLKLVGKNMPDRSIIKIDGAELALDHVTLDLDPSSGQVAAITGTSLSSVISIRKSTIVHGIINMFGSATIDESTFIASAVAVQQSNDNGTSITNNVFVAGAVDDGLSVYDPSNGSIIGAAIVADNTFVRGSVYCGLGEALLKSKFFESNIFFGTEIHGTMPGCHYDFNLLSADQALGGTGNIIGDPLFVNAAGNDFHLRAGSPAIDAADPAPRTPNTHDHDGNSRSQGGRSDIGAFEYYP